MLTVPSTDASRLLLFSDAPRSATATTSAKVRRYRLARLQLDAASRRPEGQPRYEYLKRSYD